MARRSRARTLAGHDERLLLRGHRADYHGLGTTDDGACARHKTETATGAKEGTPPQSGKGRLAYCQANLLERLQIRVAALSHRTLEPTDQIQLAVWLIRRAVQDDLERNLLRLR